MSPLAGGHSSVPAHWFAAAGRALCICSGPVTLVNGVPLPVWFCFRIKVTRHSSLPRTLALHTCCPRVSIRSTSFILGVSSQVTSGFSRERPGSHWALLYTQCCCIGEEEPLLMTPCLQSSVSIWEVDISYSLIDIHDHLLCVRYSCRYWE